MRPIGAKIASGSSERESKERRFELTPLPEYGQEDTGRREKKTAKKQPISSHQDHDGPQTGNRKQEAIRL